MTVGFSGDEGLVNVDVDSVLLEGNLIVPKDAFGLVVFAHGSGGSRFGARNLHVAELLREGGLGTLLVDLLATSEELVDTRTAHLRFDVELLANRLVGTIQWLGEQRDVGHLRIGLFGASTGGGAALAAAARVPERVKAVVSRGGRPDLAGPALLQVKAPTLLIVAEDDNPVVVLNQEAHAQLNCEKKLVIIPGATPLFEEPGVLDLVAWHAREWFEQHLK